MPAPVARFELTSIEHVPAGPDVALVRVAGLWRSAEPVELFAPHLLVDGGEGPKRIRPLPAPDGAGPKAGPQPDAWRAAYPVPAGLVSARGTSFALDAGAAGTVDLPRPSPAALTGSAEPAPARASDRERAGASDDAATAPAETERDDARRELDSERERSAALEERLAEVQARLESTGELSSKLEAAERELEQARADSQRRAAASEEELARVTAELVAVREERDGLSAEIERESSGQAADSEARRRAETRAAAAAEARQVAESRAAHAERAREQAERRVAELEAAAGPGSS